MLRESLGIPPLAPDEDGLDELGRSIDTVILHQLVPELSETFSEYELVVFVDAHVGNLPEEIREEPLEACYRPATVSHQMHPCTLLALAGEMYGRPPAGVLISLRGFDFDFGEGLSDDTASLVPAVVARILELTGSESEDRHHHA